MQAYFDKYPFHKNNKENEVYFTPDVKWYIVYECIPSIEDKTLREKKCLKLENLKIKICQ